MDLTQEAIDAGTEPTETLDAMTEVGRKFARNEGVYVPEMLISAHAMKEASALLEPLLAASGVKPEFTAVIGTVQGDLHDIGKNLVGMMLKGANFEIVDLGTNVAPEAFAAATTEHGAHIVGISALLPTTMVGPKDAVEAIRAADPKAKILVGGAPVTDEFAVEIGADGFAKNAATAPRTPPPSSSWPRSCWPPDVVASTRGTLAVQQGRIGTCAMCRGGRASCGKEVRHMVRASTGSPR